MRHVRKPCQRRSSQGISREEGHFLSRQGQTVILTEQDLDEQAVRDAVNATGYTVTSFSKEPYEKKGTVLLSA